MKEANELVAELILYAKNNLYLDREDSIYVTNLLLHRLGLRFPAEEKPTSARFVTEIMDDIVDYAVKAGITTEEEKTLFETEILGMVSPLPSKARALFDKFASERGTKFACEGFFKFCKDVNYIRTRDIAKNIKWETTGEKGNIQITINLSKPEKDPKDILRAKMEDTSKKYPKCMLCKENEGFWGTFSLPARQTLRILPISLNNESWNLQFSPYMYFDQHCIAFSTEHRPMKVSIDSFRAMLDFVELFPHYFIGSNAALPIVGGSILSHDHYQGGAKVLPMFTRGNKLTFKSDKYPSVEIGIVDWYNSVIRLTSSNRAELEAISEYILNFWNDYTDEESGIIARDSEQHNAITPITTFEDGKYTINFILRNNRCDNEHPFGIFHPAERLHNIKKEGIGIIEVMGLFILPGRLLSEMNMIKDYLLGKTDVDLDKLTPDDKLYKHIGMIKELEETCAGEKNEEKVGDAITNYINKACAEILFTTGVFKNTEQGEKAFISLMEKMGFEKC